MSVGDAHTVTTRAARAAGIRTALKPASWPKLLVPALIGQIFGIVHAGTVSVRGLALGLGFTVADLVFIVMMNDWGDREVDARKRRMFPNDCSPKTIPDGILLARTVLALGVGAGVVALAVGAMGGEWFFAGAALSIAIFVAYTLPPIALNYRGGGELLEAVGVGAALPWMNFHAQSGALFSAELAAASAGYVLLSLASATASGLSDEESDRAGGKCTIATAFGNLAARWMSESCLIAGAGAWAVATAVLGWPGSLAAAVVLALGARVFRTSGAAVTGAFVAGSAYKLYLHRAIWYGGASLAVATLFR